MGNESFSIFGSSISCFNFGGKYPRSRNPVATRLLATISRKNMLARGEMLLKDVLLLDSYYEDVLLQKKLKQDFGTVVHTLSTKKLY